MGDRIDINIVGDEKDMTKGWCQALIERVQGEYLSVIFPELPAEHDMNIPYWSTDIAQFESHTKDDYAWRREEMAADALDVLIDCHDFFKWEEATIFNIR